MGISNSRTGPNTRKKIINGKHDNIKYSLCEMRGWRPHMEDANMIIIEGENKIFGIFDGHGGYHVSKFVAKYFFKILTSLKSFQNEKFEHSLYETYYMLDNILKMKNVNSFLKSFDSYSGSELNIEYEFLKFSHLKNEATDITNRKFDPNLIFSRANSEENLINYDENIDKSKFLERKNSTKESSLIDLDSSNEKIKEENNFLINFNKDDDLENEIYCFGGVIVEENNSIDESLISYSMGTTANVIFMRNKYCYVANAGDSMAVLFKNGKAIRLNTEHKITLDIEVERIINSGSTIQNNRISGRLNLTRAIGDFMHKNNNNLSYDKQAVICCPEIRKFKITSDMEFIIMGCDGIWDCVDVQKFCEYISKKLGEKIAISVILKDIFSKMISKNIEQKVGSDNMTCLIIEFDH